MSLGILLAIVFGAGLFLVYQAPFILSEAAFDFILSAGLIKYVKKMNSVEWQGTVFGATWKPFLLVLVIALVAALVIHANYPAAHKFAEIIEK